jgi:hypothetical protein
MSPWDPPTRVKSESTSVAVNHQRSAGHRQRGADRSSSLDKPDGPGPERVETGPASQAHPQTRERTRWEMRPSSR